MPALASAQPDAGATRATLRLLQVQGAPRSPRLLRTSTVNASPRGSDSPRREGTEFGGANTASSSPGGARGYTRAQQLGFDLDGLPDSAWQTTTTPPSADTGTPAPAPAQRIEDDAPQPGVTIRPDVAQELDALLDQVIRNAPRAPEARKAQ